MPVKKLSYAFMAVCFAILAVVILWLFHSEVAPFLEGSADKLNARDAETVAVFEQGERRALGRLAAAFALSPEAADAVSADGTGKFDVWNSPDFYENNSVQFLAWRDGEGKNLFVRLYSPQSGGFVDPSGNLLEAFGAKALLPTNSEFLKTGLVSAGDRYFRAAAHAVFASGSSGRRTGYLVLGQEIGSQLIASVDNRLSIHLAEMDFASPELPASVKDTAFDFSAREYQEVAYSGTSGRHAGLVMADVEQRPAVLLQIEPRESLDMAEHVSSRFQSVVLVAAMAAALVIICFLGFAVFSPLARFAGILKKLNSREYDLSSKPEGLGMLGGLGESLLNLIGNLDRHDKMMQEKDNDLKYRIRVEEALAKVSRNLLRDSEKGIARSLRVLGRNLNTDVVSYWQIAPDRESMRCIGTFRDQVSGDFSGEYDFTAPVAGWIAEAIRHDKHLIINNVNDIPPEMADIKSFISEYELKSFLGVPLAISGGRLGGLVAFGDIRAARTWKEEDRRALEVVAELFVDMIEKAQKTQ